MFSIGLVGLGHIGSTLAQLLLLRHPDVSLLAYDINTDKAQGTVLDIVQGHSIMSPHGKGGIKLVPAVTDLAHCNVIVITAGQARFEGISGREALLIPNSAIIHDIATALKGSSACCVVVTNPVDVMTWKFYRSSGLPTKRIIGMAGVLDSGRLVLALSKALSKTAHCVPEDVSAMVLGAHNNFMVPVRSSVRYKGEPVSDEVLSSEVWSEIVAETRGAGGRIAGLLKQGSAFYGPAAAIYQMIVAMGLGEAGAGSDVSTDERGIHEKKWMPCSVWMGDTKGPSQAVSESSQEDVGDGGRNGDSGVFCGALALLGSDGVEAVQQWPLNLPLNLSLSPEELADWHSGVESVREGIEVLKMTHC